MRASHKLTFPFHEDGEGERCGRSLFRAAEAGLFGAVAVTDFVLHFGKGAFHGLNKTVTTGGHAAHRDDGVALGIVVGDGQHFTVGAEAVRGAFDDVIGGLAGAGVKNLKLGGGFDGGKAASRVGAVKDNGNGGADGVAVEGEAADEFIARGGGVAGLAGREFRPRVQEAVAINEYSRQAHAASYPQAAEITKRSFGPSGRAILPDGHYSSGPAHFSCPAVGQNLPARHLLPFMR